MKEMESPYLTKLHDTFQDKSFIFMLLEFCEGGDLAILQGRFMDRVFRMDKAIEILVDVIKGLEYLHGRGYLHRDIKLQNILVKR
jgi:serine/threonine protein kinase